MLFDGLKLLVFVSLILTSPYWMPKLFLLWLDKSTCGELIDIANDERAVSNIRDWIAEVQSQVSSEPVDATAGIYGPYQLGVERVPEWERLGFSSTSMTINFHTYEDVRKIKFVSLGHGYRMNLYVIQPDVENFEPPYGYKYWEYFEKTKTAVSCLPR